MPHAQERSDEFWKQIVEKRALSPELVEEHRRSMRETPWIPLGRILIREGILSVKQVMGLVAMQIVEPHVRIGDLAVRECLCTTEQILHCLELQETQSPGPIQLLVRDERVGHDRLVNALVGYIHFLEGQLEDNATHAECVPAYA
ncbi:MAG: hypothetical protein AAGG01_16615 [Planctomycetota bacterium]